MISIELFRFAGKLYAIERDGTGYITITVLN